MTNKEMKSKFIDWVGYIINTMLAISYVMIRSMTAGFNDINVLEIIIGGALYFIISTAMRSSMLNTGFHKGYASDRWRETAERHEQRIQTCLPYCDRMQEFLDEDYRNRLKVQRISKLRGVAFDKVFGDDGTVKDYVHPLPNLDGLDKKQIKQRMAAYRTECRNIKKARRVTVPLYHSDQLFTRSNSNKRKYTANTKKMAVQLVGGGLIISAATSILAKLFRPGGFNVVEFFIAFGMSLLAVAFSLVALYQGYAYITQTLRDDIVDKVHDLDKFNEWAKKKQLKGSESNGQNAENN